MDPEAWQQGDAAVGDPSGARPGCSGNVIEPIFEREFAAHSHGFLPGKGAGQALARVERLLTEICKYGSEGGVVHTNEPLRPLSISAF